MSTLYVRNLPDDVTDRLRDLAKREGMSLNALAVRELTHVAESADNAALLDALPSFEVDVNEILADLDAARDSR